MKLRQLGIADSHIDKMTMRQVNIVLATNRINVERKQQRAEEEAWMARAVGEARRIPVKLDTEDSNG